MTDSKSIRNTVFQKALDCLEWSDEDITELFEDETEYSLEKIKEIVYGLLDELTDVIKKEKGVKT